MVWGRNVPDSCHGLKPGPVKVRKTRDTGIKKPINNIRIKGHDIKFDCLFHCLSLKTVFNV